MAEKKEGFFKRLFRFGKKKRDEEEVVEDTSAADAAADEAARLEAERIEAEKVAAQEAAEAERLAAEAIARDEAEKKEREEREAEERRVAELARQEEEARKEETARQEAEKKEQQETARRKAEEKAGREEEQRLAAEAETARREAEEAARREEEERLAAEAARLEEEKAREEARQKAEEAERQAQAAKEAADEEAKREAERAAEAAEAQRLAAQEVAEKAKREAEERAAKAEAERLTAEKARLEREETEKRAAEEAQRLAAEEAARLEEEQEAERQAAKEAQRAEEAKREAARLEAEKLEAERLAAQEQARLEAERVELERLEAERLAALEEEEKRAVPEPKETQPTEKPAKKSWFSRMKDGLARSSNQLTENVKAVFTKRKLDEDTLQELEDILIQADLGVETAMNITDTLASQRMGKDVTDEEVRELMADEIEKVLDPVAAELELDLDHTPHVILVVGVNGSGKTTTIGKLSQKLYDAGFSTTLVAGDTFRAAAIEQLKIWGERTQSPVVSRPLGSDSAGLAFDAYQHAKDEERDVMLMDTAGRLQNKTELMDELEKIIRVLKKQDPTAPHTVLLTLDATTGQNALNQVEIFKDVSGVNGLVMTKLDGTARGGIMVAIAAKYKLPVYFIGVGEQVDDLEPFEAREFARSIAGLEV